MAGHRPTSQVVAAAVLGWAVLLAGAVAQARAPARRSAAPTVAAASARDAVHRVAAEYLTIARAGNERLEDDFDALDGRDRNKLAAARADLRDVASTERLFDSRLLRIHFPAGIERVARRLYAINQHRAELTAAVVGQSRSLHSLHAYEPMLDAANTPVEQAVTTIRRQLGLPPPSQS